MLFSVSAMTSITLGSVAAFAPTQLETTGAITQATPSGSDNRFEYVGRVIDIATQQPIAGAKVTLDLQDVPPIVYTDSEGVYQFKLLINSTASGKIRVDAQGYQTYTRNITFTPDLNQIEDIRLTPLQIPTLTSTITPTSTLTPTSTPTAIPPPTIDPTIFRGLDRNCLDRNIWEVSYYAGENQEVDDRNCWNLSAWGVIPENGALGFIVKDSTLGVNLTRRFHTKLKGNTEIKFTVRIDQLTTNPSFDGMLMMGVGSSSIITKSGFYIKYVVLGENNNLYREAAPGLKSYFEPRSAYTPGESQNIIIRIVGSQAKLIVDGNLIQSTNLLPEEHSVFWICYSLPANGGSLIGSVSNFRIEDQ